MIISHTGPKYRLGRTRSTVGFLELSVLLKLTSQEQTVNVIFCDEIVETEPTASLGVEQLSRKLTSMGTKHNRLFYWTW